MARQRSSSSSGVSCAANCSGVHAPATSSAKVKVRTELELPEGTHTVELRFMPTGLREGAALSGICLVLLILLALLDRRRKKSGIREEELSGESPEDSEAYFPEGEDRAARYFLKEDPEPKPREEIMEPEETAPGEERTREEDPAPEDDPKSGEEELLEVFGQAGGKQDIGTGSPEP